MLSYWVDPRQTRCNTLGIIFEYKDEIEKLGGEFSDILRTATPMQQTMVTFPNGYGISFISGSGSYGLEAAIITYDSDIEWDLCYDTPITDDVIGYMSEEDIVPLCKQVAELKSRVNNEAIKD